jgi:hypothetical protein
MMNQEKFPAFFLEIFTFHFKYLPFSILTCLIKNLLFSYVNLHAKHCSTQKWYSTREEERLAAKEALGGKI